MNVAFQQEPATTFLVDEQLINFETERIMQKPGVPAH